MAEFACVLFVKQKQDLTNIAENTGSSEPKSNKSVTPNVTDALKTLSMVEPRNVNKIRRNYHNPSQS